MIVYMPQIMNLDNGTLFYTHHIMTKRRKTETNDKIKAIINWLLGKMILIILLTIYIIIFYML
jgi:hypothetical protein